MKKTLYFLAFLALIIGLLPVGQAQAQSCCYSGYSNPSNDPFYTSYVPSTYTQYSVPQYSSPTDIFSGYQYPISLYNYFEPQPQYGAAHNTYPINYPYGYGSQYQNTIANTPPSYYYPSGSPYGSNYAYGNQQSNSFTPGGYNSGYNNGYGNGYGSYVPAGNGFGGYAYYPTLSQHPNFSGAQGAFAIVGNQ